MKTSLRMPASPQHPKQLEKKVRLGKDVINGIKMMILVPVPQPETSAGAKGNKPSMPGPYQSYSDHYVEDSLRETTLESQKPVDDEKSRKYGIDASFTYILS
ncbi:Gpi Ethanolamine Phosphate Transferase 2 [Manis pentadactyla]|nr:Gpi Ethanolamine Phosphate Transferase 2 [Manis pentadactyla]